MAGPPPPAQPPAQPLARVVAVVGCDGSGKTTLTADLVLALRAGGEVAFVYLGQSSGNIKRAFGRLPLVGPAIARALEKRSDAVHARPANATKPPPGALEALVIYLLSRWRYAKFRRVVGLSMGGSAVVTDRWPQAEVPGFWFDGPELPRNPGGSRFVRALAAREQALYERMAHHRPALLIRLNVDAATALARKPEEKPATLAEKTTVIPTLTYAGAAILDLDGRGNYPAVRDAAVAAARKAIAE